MERRSSSPDLIRRHIAFLTETIGVRLAGSNNERAAADHIRQTFQKEGANVVVEEFPIWEKAVEKERLEIRVEGRWKSFGCSLFGGAPGTNGKIIEAPLCFFESAVEYQRKDLSHLKGKAVVHLGCHVENESDYRRLMEAKPAFLLFVDTRYPGSSALADGLFPAYVKRSGARPTVNAAFLDAWGWKKDCADKARLYVKGDCIKSKSQNVIAEISGSDPKAGIIFAGGHHDTQSGSVGADDNAIGSVALLELGRILSGLKLKRSVRLISFGSEEQLSVGSAEYVRKHRREIERDGVFMFNFDSFGSLMGWTEINYNGSEKIGRLLDKCFQKRDIYCRLSTMVVPYSDQFAFAAAGVPGLWLGRRNCEAGRFFHHRDDDTLDRISCELSARHIDAAADFIVQIASAERIPFEIEVPRAQAKLIAKYWSSLFGGWQGLDPAFR